MVRKAKVEFDESPPDFDPNNPYGDPVAMLEYREYLVREKFIQIETAKIIRERLRWCYRIEGVNHLQKCRHLVQQYLDATRGVGWGKDARPHELHGTAPKRIPIRVAACLIKRKDEAVGDCGGGGEGAGGGARARRGVVLGAVAEEVTVEEGEECYQGLRQRRRR
ncbi:NADH-ubiquinone oxidoreductase subunit 10 [Musa troglodytarum]|uniref:NADH-ubiquinone oxidoreductase subunit 10 n=1 Tax=Musa troglodytarum TaxID=320322 RepID=A0A9E7FR99_9LILI|nr:NADH-ubiquinone oxidoreductase subunit 10 [Musa troglodytarum]